jgi:hypothetical protein
MRVERFPLLGANSPRDDQWLLAGDFVVRSDCLECKGAGHAPGTPYPALHQHPDGSLMRLPGWDSRAPIFWVHENPQSCDLVPPELTKHISQFTWGAVERYSDTCDYVMQCMYEENTIIKLDRPFWFEGLMDDMMFYVTRETSAIDQIERGFCFPDVAADADKDCGSRGYFAKVQEMYENQVFLFIKVQRDMTEPIGDWYPHRVQFELRYWQRSPVQKMLIQGQVILQDFAPLHDHHSTQHAESPYEVIDVSKAEGLRGHQYDLRITFIPVAWMDVLNKFALQTFTYVIFYFVIDGAMIILIMIIWAFFRGTTKHTSPPKLHLKEWFKGFELNPIKGMLMVFIPIGVCCSFIRTVVGDLNPLEGTPLIGDLNYEGTVTPSIEAKWRDGRMGICVLTLGFNLMQNGSMLLCPRRDKPGSIWLPGYWQRRHIMYTSALLFVLLLMALEFSFSSFFSANALVFMMMFKVVWMYMESWLLKTLNEKLIALPFECALQTAQFVMTLGATGLSSSSPILSLSSSS